VQKEMKQENKQQYVNSLWGDLINLGFGPKDLFTYRTQLDQNFKLKTLIKCKSVVINAELERSRITFRRARTNTTTDVCRGWWIQIDEDLFTSMSIVLPIILSCIRRGIVNDIAPSWSKKQQFKHNEIKNKTK
jgi:hypothetical protein